LGHSAQLLVRCYPGIHPQPCHGNQSTAAFSKPSILELCIEIAFHCKYSLPLSHFPLHCTVSAARMSHHATHPLILFYSVLKIFWDWPKGTLLCVSMCVNLALAALCRVDCIVFGQWIQQAEGFREPIARGKSVVRSFAGTSIWASLILSRRSLFWGVHLSYLFSQPSFWLAILL
jgi:hypothetical protein